jgi:hypothetical protein
MQSVFYLLGCLIVAAYPNPAHKWRVESSRNAAESADNAQTANVKHHSDLNKPGQCCKYRAHKNKRGNKSASLKCSA